MKKNINIKNFFGTKISYKNSLKKLSKKFDVFDKKIKKDFNNQDNFFNMFSESFKLNFLNKDLKRFQKYKTIVIIGMGGSVLGSEAIYEFLKTKIKKNFFFLNNLDLELIFELKKKISISKSLFIIISKSGNTIETLCNTFILKIMGKSKKNVIIISEKKNNFLYSLSKSQNLFFIQHKNFIGGRYSVLSEVGLVPAFFMGLKISRFKRNLKKFFIKNKNFYLRESSTKLSYLILKKKMTNLVFLNYSGKLEKFLYWCQQLIAESLGKKGKGFLPIVSNVPKDHHSMLQLYLDGPKDKIFYIFNVKEKSKEKIKVKSFTRNFDFINNKSLSQIKDAQKNSLKKVLKKNGIPFREITIEKVNEETLGELFCYFMLETIMIGAISGVNPFNQDAVEQVKVLTKKELSKKIYQI